MKKNLRYFFVAALAMVGMNAMADDVVFDFDNGATMFGLPGESSGTGASAVTDGDFTEAKTATIGDFSVTVSAAEEGKTTANRIWNKTPKLRMYSGTLTIKSSNANIKAITFTLANNASNSKWNEGNTVNTGTIATALPTVVWTGDANEIVFTIAGNTQISKLSINTEGGVTPPPTPTVEEITVARAIEIINGLADGATTTEEYKISAYVVGDPTWKPYTDKETNEVKNYNLSLYIGDTQSASTTLYVYNIFSLENSYFLTIDEDIKDGVSVELQGKLQKYKKDETITPEVTKAHFLRIGTKTGIEAVKANAKFDGKMYNAAGQLVNKGYKGLVIMNGKKFVNK